MTSRLDRIRAHAAARGFDASSTDQVGGLLRTLAASKPGGRFLELGTGVGLGTAYLLDGMDTSSRLVSVELDADLTCSAQETIDDVRVEWVVGDGGEWLARAADGPSYDGVFADTWPGKFSHLDEALDLVAPGGWYLVDDLSPQANWPPGHQSQVDDLLDRLAARRDVIPSRCHRTRSV